MNLWNTDYQIIFFVLSKFNRFLQCIRARTTSLLFRIIKEFRKAVETCMFFSQTNVLQVSLFFSRFGETLLALLFEGAWFAVLLRHFSKFKRFFQDHIVFFEKKAVAKNSWNFPYTTRTFCFPISASIRTTYKEEPFCSL